MDKLIEESQTEVYNAVQGNMRSEYVDIGNALNRAGEMGIIPLRFNGDQVRFIEDRMSLADYASLKPIESKMNIDNITPRPTEGYPPFDII